MSEAKRAAAAASGLEGVNAADTAISDVDGERGRLIIAGADVEQLATTTGFAAAAARVLAAAGQNVDPNAFAEALGRARAAAWAALPRLGDALAAADGMDALRTATSHLASSGDDGADAIAAIGAAPVFAAAWSRTRAGAAPIAPDPAADHAADYLRMTTRTVPAPHPI